MDRYTFSQLRKMKVRKLKEHPIGEIVKIEYCKCKVVESDDYCTNCIFENDLMLCIHFNCFSRHRKDGKNVIYQKQ